MKICFYKNILSFLMIISFVFFSKGYSKQLERHEVEEKYTWNLDPIFESLDDWQNNFENIQEDNLWGEIENYKGKIKSFTPQQFKSFLDKYFLLVRRIEKIYVYPHLLFDQNQNDNIAKAAYGSASQLIAKFVEKTSWIIPEILQRPNEEFLAIIDDPIMSEYKFILERIYDEKIHSLSALEERILASTSYPFKSFYRSFSALVNTDLVYDNVYDKDNNVYELTKSNAPILIKSMDRVLRKNTYENLSKKYLEFENTFCELLQGNLLVNNFNTQVRNYSSCLQASLSQNQIDTSIYYNLINVVKENLSILHKYVQLKKEILKLKDFYFFDLYAPIIKDIEYKVSIEEAKKIVIDSVEILGSEYQNILKKGLNEERWVDFIENKGKRGGAYSSGAYDSYPYILMNFHGSFGNIKTLAHESGHSMHTYLSKENQKYHNANYPIFLAEIASTFNELLLQEYFMKNCADDKFKMYIVAENLDRLQGAFFRQTLLAEFELKIHEMIEKGEVLTPNILSDLYLSLTKEYYGDDIEIDEYIKIGWAKIPHLYYNFYVYQYATGISAAVSFYTLIKKDANYVDQYLSFLKSGGSKNPVDLLKINGIDLSNKKVIENMLIYFDEQLELLKGLIKKSDLR